MTTMTTMEIDRQALVDRLFEATVATLELYGVYLGERLGLYRVLAGEADANAAELADKAGVHPRYAREWLEQQAVAGILTATGEGDEERRFTLPAPHREVLADPENPAYVAPFALLVAGIGVAMPAVADAFRTGGGVAWEAYGPDLRDGQAAINRPAFVHDLASWLAAMPDVVARLRSTPPARVADVACGAGWSSIALASAFPDVLVDGIDLDDAAIADATRNAAAAGVADRVSFAVRDAAEPALAGRYDLVCIFEALHDMAQPVEALEAARAMLVAGGSVLVVDERVADRFTAPGDLVERMMYGWSAVCCLPTAMVTQPSAATGTVLRSGLLREYAARAGFSTVNVLDVDNDLFRFYRLLP